MRMRFPAAAFAKPVNLTFFSAVECLCFAAVLAVVDTLFRSVKRVELTC